MDTGEKIFFVIVCLFLVFIIIEDIFLIRTWSKAKEKVFVSNWLSFLCPVLSVLYLWLSSRNIYIPIAFLICFILIIPCQFTCLSPEGIRTDFKKGDLDPIENYSYEYRKNAIGLEQLYIYKKGFKRPTTYNIGIKNPKTVKMLADWYGKHGYENPLIK